MGKFNGLNIFMLHFPFIQLPNYFTPFFKFNLYGSITPYKLFTTTIASNKSFVGIIKYCFSDIDPHGRPDTIFKSLGWISLRNRLAAIYLEKACTSKIPKIPKLEYIMNAQRFERKIKQHTVDGISRGFMLGFYLSFLELETQQHINLEVDKLIPFLELSKSKTIQIDWIIILLLHFEKFLTSSTLKSLIQNKASFQTIFLKLKDTEKTALLKNLMSYGFSIDDKECFYGQVIN